MRRKAKLSHMLTWTSKWKVTMKYILIIVFFLLFFIKHFRGAEKTIPPRALICIFETKSINSLFGLAVSSLLGKTRADNLLGRQGVTVWWTHNFLCQRCKSDWSYPCWLLICPIYCDLLHTSWQLKIPPLPVQCEEYDSGTLEIQFHNGNTSYACMTGELHAYWQYDIHMLRHTT